jgi:hypothetical protein
MKASIFASEMPYSDAITTEIPFEIRPKRSTIINGVMVLEVDNLCNKLLVVPKYSQGIVAVHNRALMSKVNHY